MCRYYYSSIFSWTDGKTGKHIEKYPECKTFIEKVKKENEKCQCYVVEEMINGEESGRY